jgi:GcrA cell cycle regulator
LTFISEYQKLIRLEWNQGRSHIRPAQRQDIMQATDWAPEHSAALREFLAKGMSYAKAADAINAKFGNRLYPQRRDRARQADGARRSGKAPGSRAGCRAEQARRDRASAVPVQPKPALVCSEPLKLRCVGIKPRQLALIDLERGDCRYPYGGDKDGEAITFCGHPRREGSSYCTPHFHLTRGPDAASEPTAGPVVLRLVRAA